MKTLGVKTLYSAMYEFKNEKGLDDIAFTPWLSTKLKIVDYVWEYQDYVRQARRQHVRDWPWIQGDSDCLKRRKSAKTASLRA